MNRHLTFRSGNPTLNAKTFSGFDITTGATMTIMGTVHKTALGLLFTHDYSPLYLESALRRPQNKYVHDDRHFWRIWCGNFDRF